MVKKVKVILYGVGAMGSLIAKVLLEKKGIEIVGAIDFAREKAGKDLGEILGLGKSLGIIISNDPDAVFSKVRADITVHATSSFLKETYPQIAKAIRHGVNVISTCEELVYPYASEPRLAKELDELAKKHGVSVLGSGINPGFLMDTLVIALTGLCQEVERIKVTRVMNAATRRVPFQKKIGAGLTVHEFREAIKSKVITGHVGLKQSISMIANALGWKLKIVVDPAEPVLAETHVESDIIKVEKGQVAGIRQRARGIKEGREVIILDFQAYIGAKEYDSVTIEGKPNINQKITPCVHGDVGTAAIIVNSMPKVINASPGLVTMKDLPIPSAVLENMRKQVRGKK